MEFESLHPWDLEYGAARSLQEDLADQVRFQPLSDDLNLVAGADVAYSRKLKKCFASVVVMTYPDLEEIEQSNVNAPSSFPYIPGLLSFREGAVVLKAFREIENVPDAVIFDGQGFAHPRRLGLACHLGLWLGLPSVGCAKSRLIGENADPGIEKGQWTDLMDGDEKLGEVVRTRTDVKPVFVSPGHLVDFKSARRLVLDCCTRYRLPEPTRQADLKVAKTKQRYMRNADESRTD